ncbi:hypothetical protein DNTS_029869 [Danionella cerebrum]|uniref:CUB domain-containing protein n=1 Tax=Danionella cerebrum TaxID=2873325 RepID=A0A553RLL3_9TELE|nr:hypothetical protein DNTS_029869 [Danionella translucida]
MRAGNGSLWNILGFTRVLLLLTIRALVSIRGQKGDGCGHTILGPSSGTVASLNFPGTYPNHTQCDWIVRVPKGQTLLVTFGDFDLERSQDCTSGSLTITDSSGTTRVGPLCGQLPARNRSLSLGTNEITVRFFSGIHRSGRGFVMSYSTNLDSELLSCLHRGTHFFSQQISAFCPAGCRGVAGEIWGWRGQGYRDTSVLCKAAVHAGVISDSLGGQISVSLQRGITLYESSFANGVLSKTGSLSDKRLVFHQECDRELPLVSYNTSSVWEEVNRLGQKVSWAPGLKGTQWAASSADQQPWMEMELWNRSTITAHSEDHITVLNSLIPPVIARYLLLKPQTWHIRASAQVQVLGCSSPLKPRSQGDELITRKAFVTEAVLLETPLTESPVISRNSGPSQAVMLVAGMVLGAALCVGKRNARMKKTCVDQACQGFHMKKPPCSNPERGNVRRVRNVHDALPNPPLNVYAEPDVVTGGQMMGLTFRPQREEGYTLPFSLNHYDTPGQLPEYTDPLPTEPEYALPFNETITDYTPSSRQRPPVCSSTLILKSELQYDCPAHRVLSNGYCTPSAHGTSLHKADVIYCEPQMVEPMLHTYHEPL